jgi:hypothetical protein
MSVELKDALLRFARDCLIASGAHVRVEDADLISATLPDGSSVRYTTTLARARAEADTELLVQGSGALATLLDTCTARAGVLALRLTEACDAIETVRTACVEPPTDCGACATPIPYGTSSAELVVCERCPLREDRFALRGLAQTSGLREVRRWDGASVELTYRVVSSDRQGRRNEWVRVALDVATGQCITTLAEGTIARAAAVAPPSLAIERVFEQGQQAIVPSLHALAAFLRLRAEEAYSRRLDEISSTFERLRRENTDTSASLETSYARELERLADVFAVDVEAKLEGVCFVTSPMAQVAFRTAFGGELLVTVDLGRGTLQPIVCAACGQSRNAVTLCRHAHAICPSCMRTDGTAAAACPICASPEFAVSPQLRSGAKPEVPALEAARGTLTLDHLAAMTPDTWQVFTRWLLEREGYQVERAESGVAVTVWHGTRDARPVVCAAMRLPEGWCLGAAEVQRAAAPLANTPQGETLLLSPAPASAEARETAERLHVHLLDRRALAELLERQEQAHMLEREAARKLADDRAQVASAARTAILAELHALEDALATAVNNRRASGGTAVARAAATIGELRTVSTQAFVAWETLADDWMHAFGEREARDGSLTITWDSPQLEALIERAGHLRAVLHDAFTRLGQTPGGGELGYGAWRKAVLEEMAARCEALHWRFAAIDPAHWRGFTAAHDAQAHERAESMATAAGYARARAEKAYAQLESRVRL